MFWRGPEANGCDFVTILQFVTFAVWTADTTTSIRNVICFRTFRTFKWMTASASADVQAYMREWWNKREIILNTGHLHFCISCTFTLWLFNRFHFISFDVFEKWWKTWKRWRKVEKITDIMISSERFLGRSDGIDLVNNLCCLLYLSKFQLWVWDNDGACCMGSHRYEGVYTVHSNNAGVPVYI